MTHSNYKIASDISCSNMVALSQKHADENHKQFINRMISLNCGNGGPDGYLIQGEWINPKHCQYKRSEYEYSWWDDQFGNCVGEQFNISTKAKFNDQRQLFKSNCNPPDFSKANQVCS